MQMLFLTQSSVYDFGIWPFGNFVYISLLGWVFQALSWQWLVVGSLLGSLVGSLANIWFFCLYLLIGYLHCLPFV